MNVAQATRGLDTPSKIRLFCRFEGWVQGVGFRWTMQKLAVNAGVSGWVRNEPDGAVECELQGQGTAICKVLNHLDGEFSRSRNRLRRSAIGLDYDITECKELPVETEDSGQFRVRY